MKRLLTLVAFFATLEASAQQVNPVPDYVFRNQMSVGRGTVTDTAAYFSIGPRYGATKGFMPPIVGDTATFSSGKRNGLLIFSVQKNKFLYWDSVRVQWSDMAGSSGAYIVAGDTAAMLAPYLRKADTTAMLTPYIRHAGYGLTKSGQSFVVDTLNISTRAWRQKGLDSLAALEVSGSGTTNYVAKFTASGTIGNSLIFDNGSRIGVNTATPDAGTILHTARGSNGTVATFGIQGLTINPRIRIDASETNNTVSFNTNYNGATSPAITFLTAETERLRITSGGNVGINDANPTDMLVVNGRMRVNGTNRITFGNSSGGYAGIGVTGATTGNLTFNTFDGTSDGERLRIFANGRIGINTTTDAGYQLDVNGSGRFSGALRAQGTIQATNNNDNNSGDFTGMVIGSSTTGTARTASFIKNTSSPYDFTIRTQDNTATTTGSMIFQNGSTETMRITSGGNVGIGTASPSGKLTVVGASINTYISIDNAGSGENYYASNAFQQWQTAGSARMTLNSAGELLINTTTDAGNYKLQVSGQAFIRNTATSGALYLDSTSLSIYEVKNRHAILISGHSLTGAEIQGPIYVGTNWNTSSDVSAIEVALTNTASGANSNLMKLSDGTNTFRVTKDAGIFTAAPSGGTARKWKLGSVVSTSVILDTANYVEVEINGVAYKLALATPN